MQPTSAHVLVVWGAVAVISILDALILRDQATGAVYVSVNIFVVLASLVLFAHIAGRKPEAQYASMSVSATPSARTELMHIFLHVLCVLYVRAAVWFELRARG